MKEFPRGQRAHAFNMLMTSDYMADRSTLLPTSIELWIEHPDLGYGWFRVWALSHLPLDPAQEASVRLGGEP